LKEFLNRFEVQLVRLKPTDEAMTVHAFTKGMLPVPFSESLLRYYPKTFCEIRRRAMAHIAAKDQVTKKRSFVVPVQPRASGRPQPMRVHEATIEKKGTGKQQPYEKPQTRTHTRRPTSQAQFSCRARGVDRYSLHRGKIEGPQRPTKS